MRRAINRYIQPLWTLGKQVLDDIIQLIQLLELNGLHDSRFRTFSGQLKARIHLVDGVDPFSARQSCPSDGTLLENRSVYACRVLKKMLTPTGPRPQMPTMSPFRTPVSLTPKSDSAVYYGV
jgi:hypothetical protein